MKYTVNLTWQDVPHLDEKAKKELLASYSPHERDARSKGLPQLGTGCIYPVCEDDIRCSPFMIPIHWPRAYGLDVGYASKTAAVFGAYDSQSDTWYLYAEHYRGQTEPSVHADAIRKCGGTWMTGVIDSAANQHHNQLSLMELYTELGLTLVNANKAVEAGILEVYQRLSSGRLKVFSTMQNWLGEFRSYHRDKNGNVAQKQDDHLMDATRYLIMTGLNVLELPGDEDSGFRDSRIQNRPTVGKSKYTGY